MLCDYNINNTIFIELYIICLFAENMTRDKCSVQGCSLGSRRMRALPNIKTDKERRLKWIAACGNPSLINRTSKNLQICDEHFEARYKLNSRLSKSAVPTLHLPSMYIYVISLY